MQMSVDSKQYLYWFNIFSYLTSLDHGDTVFSLIFPFRILLLKWNCFSTLSSCSTNLNNRKWLLVMTKFYPHLHPFACVSHRGHFVECIEWQRDDSFFLFIFYFTGILKCHLEVQFLVPPLLYLKTDLR